VSPQIKINFDLHLDESAIDRVKEIFEEELQAACTDIGEHVQGRVQRKIEKDKIWYTGNLLNSITWSLIEETASVIGVVVGTNVAYAKYQEYGTVPHFVPFHMAKTLYDQAVSDWGWIKVTPGVSARLNAGPGKAVTKGPGDMYTITGKHQTYLTKNPERLWLKPYPDARPVWGVTVSGNKQPFLWPGWEESVEFCERRLNEACERASARIGGGS
jgi:phage gpG-like protein